jgi:hypothetical protein
VAGTWPASEWREVGGMEKPSAQDAEQMRARLQQWRQAHPRATFDEIEEAVQQEVARWQAQLVAELASEGAGDSGVAGAGSATAGGERPVCTACGTPMQRCGRRSREVLSRLGQPLRLERTYYVCPHCGAGVFPPG